LSTTGRLVSVGRVGKAHGLDGSFYVVRPSHLLPLGMTLTVGGRTASIERRAGTDQRPLIRLSGISDRESVAAIVGEALMADLADAPLESDEWLSADLIGCEVPGVGKVTETHLHACGIRKVGDLARLDEAFLEQRFGKWGLALAGKSHGMDAGGWFDTEVGEGGGPKSISHEHTFSVDTADTTALDGILVRLSEMVARRLRDHHVWARTVQIKLRYTDFSTFTRSRTLDHASQIDAEIACAARDLFHKAWTGKPIRLLGVYAQSLGANEGQTSLIDEPRAEDWRRTLAAVDKIREKYGQDGIVSLAAGMKAGFRARVHENPENLPGKDPKKD